MSGSDATRSPARPTAPLQSLQYEFRDRLEPAEVEYWWAVYEEAFRESNVSSPERQTMNEDEFTIAMLEPAVSKLVAYDDRGIAALTVFGPINRSDIFTWLSQEYFAHHYPDLYPHGGVQYFVTTLTRPDVRAGGVMGSMGQLITDRLMGDHREVVVIYDCCESNSWLPEALYALVELTLESAGAVATPLDRIGAQVFYAFGMAHQIIELPKVDDGKGALGDGDQGVVDVTSAPAGGSGTA